MNNYYSRAAMCRPSILFWSPYIPLYPCDLTNPPVPQFDKGVDSLTSLSCKVSRLLLTQDPLLTMEQEGVLYCGRLCACYHHHHQPRSPLLSFLPLVTRAVDRSDSHRHFCYLRTGAAIIPLSYGLCDDTMLMSGRRDKQMETRAGVKIFVAPCRMSIRGGRGMHTSAGCVMEFNDVFE